MQLIRKRLVELGLIAGLLSTFSPILCIQVVQAQSTDTSVASVNGKYSDLIQVVNCPNDRSSYGEFYEWGYWGGTSWCGRSTQPGYWVWVNPNWYIWRNVGIARPTNPTPSPSATRLNPTPYPSARLGSLDYYRFRYDDFVRRNPGVQPPDYYLNFGEKYLRRFRLEVRPNLTEQGQAFVDRVGVALQRRMEAELRSDPSRFAELERDSARFREFAYETHIAAYCRSGWGDLPLSDNRTIARSVDASDFGQGLGTSISISNECGWLRDAWDSLPFP